MLKCAGSKKGEPLMNSTGIALMAGIGLVLIVLGLLIGRKKPDADKPAETAKPSTPAPAKKVQYIPPDEPDQTWRVVSGESEEKAMELIRQHQQKQQKDKPA
jgi:hypothetical protein